MKEKITRYCCFGLIGVFTILCVFMLVKGLKTRAEEYEAPVKIEPTVIKEHSSLFVEEETVISVDIINDGLRDMGELITAEYYFTNVEDYAVYQTYFKLITTESSCVFSYDGVVKAGIDFGKIEVDKNDKDKVITVTLPKSEIMGVEIDYESFKIISEKNALFNHLEFSDYNRGMIKFTNTAKENALERGILTNADKQAVTIVRNFVKGIVGNDYSITVR